MRLLREMETIQIDITNACVHECSNCTRMCGNHKKPFMMGFDIFKAAVDSLEDFEGMIGIIGGEPVLHPEFDRFMEYAGSVRKERILRDSYFNKPKKDYLQAMYSYSAVMKQIAKARGIVLTSSMPKQYYKHFERITDTATFYRINDHSKPSYHQPSMISYKDLGIPYDEFLKLRDNCWLHGKWSATIMPKGAFFCEMAGALDQLFNGPGGWKIEPGWWMRGIEEYADQWHWCELCGMCLATCTRDANEEIDDVSETLHHMLEEIDSPRIKQGKVHLYTAKEQDERSKATIAGNYMLDYRERLGAAKKNLLPKSIETIMPNDLEEIRKQDGFSIYDWIVLPEGPDLKKLKETVKKLGNMFLNPGVLYQVEIGRCRGKIFNVNATAFREIIKKYNDMDGSIDWRAELSQWSQEKQYIIHEGFENDPDVDMTFYEDKMLEGYQSDDNFMKELGKRLGEMGNLKKNIPILLPMVSNLQNMRAITRLLLEMGHDVHIMAGCVHEKGFIDLLPDKNLHLFENDKFDYQKLEKFTDTIKDKYKFDGCIIPTSATADHLINWDGYDEVIRLMEHMEVPILGIINAKRRFCECNEV